MATLILTRPRQLADMLRPYDIVIDGDRVASIGRGQTIELELAPGLHGITARNSSFGSERVELEVGPEGRYHLEVGNNWFDWPLLAVGLALFGWTLLAQIVVFALLTSWEDPTEGLGRNLFVSFVVSISPVLLLAIACFTRWRNTYLYLRQIPAAGSPARRSRLNLKWRPRVSVRGLMIAVLVLGSVLGLIFQRARVQREAVRAIKDAGGTVRYQWEQIGSILLPGTVSPTWWDSLMTRLGPDYFGRVVWVGFPGNSAGESDDGVLVHIARLDSLEVLDFSPLDLSRPNFASHRSVTDAGLAHLRRLPRLRHLNLSRTGVRGPGLAQLQGMSRLRWLELLELPLKDDDLIHLEGLKSLNVLILSSNGITDEGLAHLAGLTNLRQLRLESRWITSAGLRHLSGMKQLSQLVLNSPRIISLRPLEQLSELWWLDLSGTATGSADLATIARSKKLFYLNLSFTQIEDVGLAHLAGLSELNSLSLLDTRITDAGLDLLTGLTKCRYLHVDATGVTDGGVASLAAKFPAMNVTHSRPFDRKESLAQLRESGQPKELNLSNLLLRDDDLIDLKRLK